MLQLSPTFKNGVHDVIFKFTKGSYQNYLLSLNNVLNYLKVPKYYHKPSKIMPSMKENF